MLTEPEITAPLKPTQRTEPALAPDAPLTPSQPMIVLGFRCMQRQYAALVAHGPRGSSAVGIDDVHRMRIAIRRLRVALRLFGHMLPGNAAAELSGDLRWLGRGLGTVRDLDVHTEEFRDHVKRAAPEHARDLGTYELDLRRQHTAARNELREVLASERYRTLMAALDRLVGRGPSSAALRRFKAFRIRDGARTYLRRSRKKVVKLGRKLDESSDADDLHRLRIRAKRLRYELEFFLEPYPELGAMIAAVKDLQDVLGKDRDALLGAARLAEYRRQQRGRRRDGAVPIAALDDWAARHAESGRTARQELPAVWHDVDAALAKSAFESL